MHRPASRALVLVLALSAAAQMASPGLPAMETPLPSVEKEQVERGRRIYLEGVSSAGRPITAVMGDRGGESLEVPATALTCGSCHGRDGRGGKEGGVSPSDLSWRSLSRPYEVTTSSGRKHRPYDDRALVKAIAMGVDPGGNPLHIAMPRFRMAREDMQDLVAYLHHLGEEIDPGVSEGAVRIGVLVPREGPLAGMGRAVQATLAARFEALNRQGGLYGRKLELKVGETTGPPEQQRGWTADFLEREGVFAAVGALLVGADAELAALFDERRIPLIGPFTLDPRETFPLNRYVFYLSSGPAEQARALVDHARRLPWGVKPKAWGVLAPAGPSPDGAVEAVRKQAAAAGWPEAKILRYGGAGLEAMDGRTGEALRTFAAGGVDPIVILGSGTETLSLLELAERLAWHPHVLGVATAAEGLFQAPGSFAGKIAIALPALPGAATREAANAYRALATEYHLPAEHLSAQLSALAGAEVLIDALQRTGRDLSREKLIAQLEDLRRFQTGFAPPLTFGPNQRLGARGAYVFPLDLAQRRLAPEGGWLEVAE